jgi:hypothetical protein
MIRTKVMPTMIYGDGMYAVATVVAAEAKYHGKFTKKR